VQPAFERADDAKVIERCLHSQIEGGATPVFVIPAGSFSTVKLVR
jgi:hypothetical protein